MQFFAYLIFFGSEYSFERKPFANTELPIPNIGNTEHWQRFFKNKLLSIWCVYENVATIFQNISISSYFHHVQQRPKRFGHVKIWIIARDNTREKSTFHFITPIHEERKASQCQDPQLNLHTSPLKTWARNEYTITKAYIVNVYMGSISQKSTFSLLLSRISWV